MRPWTQPERQLKREKQNCSWICLLPIIPFFLKKEKKNHLFQDQLSFLEGLVWKWSEMMVFIPSFSKYHRQELSHRRGFRFVTFGTCTATWTGQTNKDDEKFWVDGVVTERWGRTDPFQWLVKGTYPGIPLVKPRLRHRWFNRKQIQSEPNKVWPMWGNCSRAVWRKETFFEPIYLAKTDGGSRSAATCGVSCLLSGGSQPSCCPCCFFFFPSFMEKCWCLFLPVPPKLRV